MKIKLITAAVLSLGLAGAAMAQSSSGGANSGSNSNCGAPASAATTAEVNGQNKGERVDNQQTGSVQDNAAQTGKANQDNPGAVAMTQGTTC